MARSSKKLTNSLVDRFISEQRQENLNPVQYRELLEFAATEIAQIIQHGDGEYFIALLRDEVAARESYLGERRRLSSERLTRESERRTADNAEFQKRVEANKAKFRAVD